VADASRLATQGDAFLALLVTASLQPEEPITCVRSLYVCNQTLGAFTAIILGPGHAFNRHRLGDMFEACLYVTGHPAVASDAPHPWASTWDDAGLERAWRCVLALKAWVTGKGTAAPIADPHAPGVVLTAQAVAPVVPDAHAASDAKRELAQGAQAVEQRLQQERALRLHASITAGDYSAALDLADADQRARTTAALAHESAITAAQAAASAPDRGAPSSTPAERQLDWFRPLGPTQDAAAVAEAARYHTRPQCTVYWVSRSGVKTVAPAFYPCCGRPCAAAPTFCPARDDRVARHTGNIVLVRESASGSTKVAAAAVWSCCHRPVVTTEPAPRNFDVWAEYETGCGGAPAAKTSTLAEGITLVPRSSGDEHPVYSTAEITADAFRIVRHQAAAAPRRGKDELPLHLVEEELDRTRRRLRRRERSSRRRSASYSRSPSSDSGYSDGYRR
jgi:hypothetical protein